MSSNWKIIFTSIVYYVGVVHYALGFVFTDTLLCESLTGTFRCNSNEYVVIRRALYGRSLPYPVVCGDLSSRPPCQMDVTASLMPYCYRPQLCSFPNIDAFHGQPCTFVREGKYLTLQKACVPASDIYAACGGSGPMMNMATVPLPEEGLFVPPYYTTQQTRLARCDITVTGAITTTLEVINDDNGRIPVMACGNDIYVGYIHTGQNCQPISKDMPYNITGLANIYFYNDNDTKPQAVLYYQVMQKDVLGILTATRKVHETVILPTTATEMSTDHRSNVELSTNTPVNRTQPFSSINNVTVTLTATQSSVYSSTSQDATLHQSTAQTASYFTNASVPVVTTESLTTGNTGGTMSQKPSVINLGPSSSTETSMSRTVSTIPSETVGSPGSENVVPEAETGVTSAARAGGSSSSIKTTITGVNQTVEVTTETRIIGSPTSSGSLETKTSAPSTHSPTSGSVTSITPEESSIRTNKSEVPVFDNPNLVLNPQSATDYRIADYWIGIIVGVVALCLLIIALVAATILYIKRKGQGSSEDKLAALSREDSESRDREMNHYTTIDSDDIQTDIVEKAGSDKRSKYSKSLPKPSKSTEKTSPRAATLPPPRTNPKDIWAQNQNTDFFMY